MDFMGTSEAAKKWGLSQAYVSTLCRNGKIPAEQDDSGKPWRIPTNTPNPKKSNQEKKERE